MFQLKYIVAITCCAFAAVIGLDDFFQNRNGNFGSTGANWWWNLKSSHGDQLTGNELYYPGQEVLARMKDGGYHYWWWGHIMKTFGRGNVINTQQPLPPAPPTTSTIAPTTTPDYPPWPTSCARTETDSLGPFYTPFIPFPPRHQICTTSMITKSRVDVSGYVLKRQSSSDCSTMIPVGNAKIEIWQADLTDSSRGEYRSECTGYIMTDSRGFYNFTASLPGLYSGRPRHIHYKVTTDASHAIPNVYLVTQMYFASDPSGGKRTSLIVQDPEIKQNHRVTQFNFIV